MLQDIFTGGAGAILLGIIIILAFNMLYTNWHTKKLQSTADLQHVRSVIGTNLVKFNAMTAPIAALQAGKPLAKDWAVEVGKLYAEGRDIFRLYQHRFKEDDRAELESKINKVEEEVLKEFPDSKDLTEGIINNMHGFLERANEILLK